jgi:3-polyprenyl-4-hydroxybenzoate decarboxylase
MGVARQVLEYFTARRVMTNKHIVVDEDVDPWDADDVMWAISTRCQANTDIVMMPASHCRLDPSVELDGTSCLLGIDATKSKEPFPRHSVCDWVAPRKEMEAWKEKILKHMEGGKRS